MNPGKKIGKSLWQKKCYLMWYACSPYKFDVSSCLCCCHIVNVTIWEPKKMTSKSFVYSHIRWLVWMCLSKVWILASGLIYHYRLLLVAELYGVPFLTCCHQKNHPNKLCNMLMQMMSAMWKASQMPVKCVHQSVRRNSVICRKVEFLILVLRILRMTTFPL